MGLINGNQIVELVRAYRLCWISGKYSGGKTSFAFYLAKKYLREGYRLLTNNQCIWNDPIKELELFPADHPKHANLLRAVVILDEGGLYFESGKQVKQIAAYSAKMDCIYIIPSFFPPAPQVQVLTIQPIFGFQSAGLPIIVYQWKVRINQFKDGGWFAWVLPQEIYGVYSRQDPGADPERLVEFLTRRVRDFRARMGHGSQGNRDTFSALGAQVSEADLLRDAVQAITETSHTIEAVSARSSKSRRK